MLHYELFRTLNDTCKFNITLDSRQCIFYENYQNQLLYYFLDVSLFLVINIDYTSVILRLQTS